jgi:peptide/nickel transport system permease protein
MDRPANRVLDVPARAAERPAALSTAARRWRAARRHWLLWVGLAIVALYLLIALLAPLIAPYDPVQSFTGARLRPPSPGHPFGTDDFSRDVLSRTIHGTRVSVTVGLSVTLLTTLVGGVLGLLVGYYRSLDRVLMRVLDGLMAFPAILLAIAVAAALRPSLGTVIVALALVYTPYVVRVLRAPVLANRELAYVEAARNLGASDLRILLVHLLPNSVAPLVVQATFTFSFAVLAEATLSFLGVGVPPPTPSWGNMLSDAKIVLQQAPWLTWAPGLALVIVTLGLNLLGDGLRDILDPRHVTQVGGAERPR